MSNESKKPGRPKKGQRKDGLIAVYEDLGRSTEGKRIRKTFYGKTWAEADAKRKAYLETVQEGTPVGSDALTVSAWCDMWLASYKPDADGHTKLSYIAYINRLKDDLGETLIKDIRHIHLQASLNKMAGMSKSSISQYRGALQQIFKRARQNKIIRDDPAEDLSSPNGVKGTHRALERWEADCIIANWKEHRSGIWAMLMLLCGLRRGEMIALDWSSINMIERRITVHEAAVIESNQSRIKPHTKTDAGMRILPICQLLYDALTTVPEDKREGRVCLSANNKQLSFSAFDRGWDGFNLAMQRILNGEPVKQQGRRETLASKIELAKKEGRKYILFSTRAHDLRFTFATALYDAGVDVKSAQYYLGHADIRMTMDLYTQLSKERENASRAKTVNFLDSWVNKEVYNALE